MKNSAFLIICIALLAGCASTPEPQLTPLEIQSLQTRTYENPKDIVFASVVSVFQDLGYQIETADIASGLISSESAASSNAGFGDALIGRTRVEKTRATAFVEQIGSSTQVRLNFLVSNRTSSAYGQTDQNDQPILDADIYQNAFERVENAIFIRDVD